MDYEVVLTHAACEAVRELGDEDQKNLANAISTELDGRRSSDVSLGPEGRYTARNIRSGHIVAFRPLSPNELAILSRDKGRRIDRAFVIHDILGVESVPPTSC